MNHTGTTAKIMTGFILLGIVLAGAGMLATHLSGAELGAGLAAYHLVAGLAAGFLPFLFLKSSLLDPLSELRCTIQATRGDGDLSRRSPIIGCAATGETARAFNDLMDSFQGIIGKVCFNSVQVADAAEILTREANNVAGGSGRQHGAAEATMHAMEEMNTGINQAAKDIGRVLEEAVKGGQIRLDDLFDHNYAPIPNTRPQKYTSKFDALTDKLFPPVQEPVLEANREAAYAGAVDINGYFPTHNRRFSKPLTGDEKADFVNNRTKRIFSDPVGKKCGAHEQPFLLQTYRRDTGEIMHDLSVPIYVQGRHWGGFRLGYCTE